MNETNSRSRKESMNRIIKFLNKHEDTTIIRLVTIGVFMLILLLAAILY